MENTKRSPVELPDKPQKRQKGEYVTTRENPYLRLYYTIQLQLPEDQMESLYTTLQKQLPITFRVNHNAKMYENFVAHLDDKQYIRNLLGDDAPDLEVIKVPWFPGGLAYQFGSYRSELKKAPGMKRLHGLIQKANESGLITRQELVSMLPPVLLDIQPGQTVVDMCAAPGSKTAQIIELLRGQGCVVANDVDTNRAFMLIHQLHRSNTSCMMVVNYPAQNFPALGTKQNRFKFDRVLCDVPCSGDGAMRKLPLKWREWNVRDALALHVLQMQILERALNVCKEGGYVCYSTCSLSPIEDESVVCEILRKHGETVELVDLREKLNTLCPGLIYRPGLKHWKVFSNSRNKEDGPFVEFEKIEDVPAEFRTIKASMFPVNVPEEIQYTVRMLPHDNNTGGFYLALFRKKDLNREVVEEPELEVESPLEAQEKPEEVITPDLEASRTRHHNKMEKEMRGQTEYQRLERDSEDFRNICEFWGIDPETFPAEQLLSPSVKKNKNLYFINEAVKNVLDQAPNRGLRVLNMGAKAFQRNPQKITRDRCKYRVCQDALDYISKYITKRRVLCTDLNAFRLIVTQNEIKDEDIADESARLALKEDIGHYILHFSNGNVNEELLVIRLTQNRLVQMFSKEHAWSLQIRYDLLN